MTSRATIPTIPPPKRATRAIGHKPRMGNFMRVLLGVTALAHIAVGPAAFFVATRFGLQKYGVAVAIGAVACGIALFLGRARASMPDRRRSPLVVRFVDIPYFVHWCAGLWTIVPSIVAILGYAIVGAFRGGATLPPAAFFFWAYASGFVIAGYGIVIRRRWFQVRTVDVDVVGLDPAFDGYTIAHLSDLHIGGVTPKSWGDRWVEAANAHGADLAVVTGDLVTSGTDFHEDIAEIVGALRAKDGTFVTMGNHDYFGEGEPLVSLLTARGARVLRNEGQVISRGDAAIYLAGVDDTWTKRADLERALHARPAGMTTVLLAHDPEGFRAAAKKDVALVLSGHTHGGQVALPFFAEHVSFSHLTHHFHLGLYKKGRSTLYVHPGLGTTGPPIRIGVAPAVVILKLRAA